MEITTFNSGASAYYDALGLAKAGKGIGVVATEVPPRTIALLRLHLRNGGKVFVDSGAFQSFMQGIRKGVSSPVDFDAVFGVYEAILHELDHESAARLFLVMPDKIGDQAGTLSLLASYRSRIHSFLKRGAEIVVAVQRGELAVTDALKETVAVLGTTNFRLGIPSNAEALPDDELRSIRWPRFHLLGKAAMDKRMLSRLDCLTEGNPFADISCDANRFRAMMDGITRVHKAMISEAGESGFFEQGDMPMLDSTELMYEVVNVPAWMTPAQVKAVAEACLVFSSEEQTRWHKAHRTIGLSSLIDEEMEDHLYNQLQSIFNGLAERMASARLRAEAIAAIFADAA